MARIVILSSNTRKSTILTIFFCNPKIQELGCHQSWNSALVNTAGIAVTRLRTEKLELYSDY